jgi:hypothetical protein
MERVEVDVPFEIGSPGLLKTSVIMKGLPGVGGSGVSAKSVIWNREEVLQF